MSQFLHELRRGLGGKIIGDVDHLFHLLPHRFQNMRMVKSKIDAFVGASEIKDASTIRGVNPTSPRFGHWYWGITPLGSPALH